MENLKHTFMILEFCGLWRPLNWSSTRISAKLYKLYGLLMILIYITFIISQLIKLVITGVDDIDNFANSTFFILLLIADGGKGINILAKRNDIIKLMETLKQDPCRPKNEHEFAIQRKFDRMNRLFSSRYMGLVMLTGLVIVLNSIIENIPSKTLPYMSWLPFDYSESWFAYSIAYIHQLHALILGASVCVAFDTLVLGLMIHTEAQLNILMHRFNEMPMTLFETATTKVSTSNKDESNSQRLSAETFLLSQRVQHHLAIFKLAEKSNDIFSVMIFLQYFMSITILCISLIRVSKLTPFSPAFTSACITMTEMSVQILVFCYYGGNVSIESLKVSDAIYEMDWQVLSTSARRSLVTIMARCSRPITFTTIHVIILNLDSFKSIVKLSYSIYNVL